MTSMAKAVSRVVRSNVKCLPIGAVMLLHVCAIVTGAQTQGGLVITSPVPGTEVQPGQSVAIVLNSPDGLTFDALMVSGEIVSPPLTLPVTVTVTIPQDQDLGVGYIDAAGVTTNGQAIEAPSVRIVIERPEQPLSLAFEHRTLPFNTPGVSVPVRVNATFPGGVIVDVSHSTRLSLASSHPMVVAVGDANQVSAVGVGDAVVTATYQAQKSLEASLAVSVGPPNLTPSPAILQFGGHQVGSSETRSLTLTNSHRDDAMTVGVLSAAPPFSAQSDCVERSPLAPGETCTATIIFSPAKAGAFRSVLRVQTSFSSAAEGVTLLGEGLGDPPTDLIDLTTATSWLGLKNSDDQGTRFDVRAEVYRGATLVSSALTRCIAGVTRNPNNALQVASTFGDFAPVTLTSGELLTFKVSTRIGTNADDTKCPGHNNATGLRFYYDAPNRPSRLGVAFGTSAAADQYLHTAGGADVLNTTAPTNATALYKDSAAINFNGGNPWRVVGQWQLTVP